MAFNIRDIRSVESTKNISFQRCEKIKHLPVFSLLTTPLKISGSYPPYYHMQGLFLSLYEGQLQFSACYHLTVFSAKITEYVPQINREPCF